MFTFPKSRKQIDARNLKMHTTTIKQTNKTKKRINFMRVMIENDKFLLLFEFVNK